MKFNKNREDEQEREDQEDQQQSQPWRPTKEYEQSPEPWKNTSGDVQLLATHRRCHAVVVTYDGGGPALRDPRRAVAGSPLEENETDKATEATLKEKFVNPKVSTGRVCKP